VTPAEERADPSLGPADFAINARVRQVLTRRWVLTEGLEVGTTDGVVLIKGQLEREPGGLTMGTDADAGDRFVRRLRSEIKAIPGVTDVVMEIRGVERGAR
jgi:hypothetical protein